MRKEDQEAKTKNPNSSPVNGNRKFTLAINDLFKTSEVSWNIMSPTKKVIFKIIMDDFPLGLGTSQILI
jgi:hypothetical protein